MVASTLVLGNGGQRLTKNFAETFAEALALVPLQIHSWAQRPNEFGCRHAGEAAMKQVAMAFYAATTFRLLRNLAVAVAASGFVSGLGYWIVLRIAKQVDMAHGLVLMPWLGTWPVLLVSTLAALGLCASRCAPDTRDWRLARWLMLPVVAVLVPVLTYAIMMAAIPLDVTLESIGFFVFNFLACALPALVAPLFGRSIAVCNAVIAFGLTWPVVPRFIDGGMAPTLKPRYALLAGLSAGLALPLVVARPRQRVAGYGAILAAAAFNSTLSF